MSEKSYGQRSLVGYILWGYKDQTRLSDFISLKALEVRLDLLGGRDQVAKARTRPSGWEGSAVPGFLGSLRTGAWLVAQVGRVNAQGLVMMS